MPSAWILPSAIWWVLHVAAGCCRKGAVSASRASGVCDKGTVTASTPCAIRRGTNVTVSCQLGAPPGAGCCCSALFLNSSEQIRGWGGSVSKTFLVSSYGRHTFSCKSICRHRARIVCGIDILCGNPPDQPRNVSCIQRGTRGHPTCTWDKGRPTYLHTAYGIELSNGTDAFCFPEDTPSQEFLGQLDLGSNYTVVVFASNELGNASSQPLSFTLMDIVKPNPPEFVVEFDESSASSCSISWQGEAQAQHYRLRYRPLSSPGAWSTVESSSTDKYHLQGLEPGTAYEFQVSCRLLPGRGLWSDWSRRQSHTPAAVPSGTLDVWYRLQDLGSGHQNLSLFWKALSKSEAGGTILGYTVTLEALEQGNVPAQSHRTNRTSFSRVTPRVCHRVTVTAHNSRGSSRPAAVLTHLGRDLPPPQRVSAEAQGNSSILVSWSPPVGSPLPLGGFVVEWAEPRGEPDLQPQQGWVKLPPSRLSTVLAEHIRDNVCYHIHVSALYQGRAGQAASVRGNATAQAPSAGPRVFSTPWAGGVLVSWEEIPAAQQRGCITAYHIYLHRRDGQGQPELHAAPAGEAPRSLHIPGLEPGQRHHLWVTAATAAGEGPRGNTDSVCLESAEGWGTPVLICSFFILSACVCSVPAARRVFQGLLSLLLPQWHSKAIPDPANATWAKSLRATEAELSAAPSPFLPCAFEEPETSPVEEPWEHPQHPEPRIPAAKAALGSGDWAREGSEEEQQLPGLYQRLLLEPEDISNRGSCSLTTDTEPGYICTPGSCSLSPNPAPEYISNPCSCSLPPEPAPGYLCTPGSCSLTPDTEPGYLCTPGSCSLTPDTEPGSLCTPGSCCLSPDPAPGYLCTPGSCSLSPNPAPEYISNPCCCSLPPDPAPWPSPIPVFPAAFPGNLTLDGVRLSCGSFPR